MADLRSDRLEPTIRTRLPMCCGFCSRGSISNTTSCRRCRAALHTVSIWPWCMRRIAARGAGRKTRDLAGDEAVVVGEIPKKAD